MSQLEEIEEELKNGFTSFYHFSLNLIENLSKGNGNLKFAVVNMQIALELFLKYYFVKKGKAERVVVIDSSKTKFKDFSDVLSAYFSSVRWSYMDKKHLKAIMESRNAIVHRGKHNEWNEELANYIVTCALFIQGTLKAEFSETLLLTGHSAHKLSSNPIWRKGSEDFAKAVAGEFDCKSYTCLFCQSKAMVDKECFNFDETHKEGFQCVSCLQDLELDYQIALINCYACSEKAFVIDCLNEQQNQFYDGCCISCGLKDSVRKCENCEAFYFAHQNKEEINVSDKYFCSHICSELISEI